MLFDYELPVTYLISGRDSGAISWLTSRGRTEEAAEPRLVCGLHCIIKHHPHSLPFSLLLSFSLHLLTPTYALRRTYFGCASSRNLSCTVLLIHLFFLRSPEFTFLGRNECLATDISWSQAPSRGPMYHSYSRHAPIRSPRESHSAALSLGKV